MDIKYKNIYINKTEKLALNTAITKLKYMKGFEATTQVLAQLLIRSENKEV
jgi:hypothetical protein